MKEAIKLCIDNEVKNYIYGKEIIENLPMEQRLFRLVDIHGELLKGDLHIIDISDDFNKKYRINHKSGYCLDVKEEYNIELEIAEYSWYSSFDGFKKITDVNKAYKLFYSWLKVVI